jgi:hypothetical protein
MPTTTFATYELWNTRLRGAICLDRLGEDNEKPQSGLPVNWTTFELDTATRRLMKLQGMQFRTDVIF